MTTFLFALWALLLTPGPTNSLVALSGMQAGFGRSLRLLPVELGAYLLTVVPLTLAGRALFAAWPGAIVAVKLAAALWIARLAVRHWSLGRLVGAARGVSAPDVFVTTLLNPKALVFGCVLLPAVADRVATGLALFALSVTATGLIWLSGGALVGARLMPVQGGGGSWLHRAVAGWLALLSAGLVGSALG